MRPFQIEQIAICPADPKAAMELLTDMGATNWTHDHVTALGSVFNLGHILNEADLSFNYEMMSGKELEVLNYTDGPNWMQQADRRNSVSHLGMHVTADELFYWRTFFVNRGIKIAQEVNTESHTNPAIAGRKKYNYVIFDTKAILGVDLKFIVRILVEHSVVECLKCGDRHQVPRDMFHGHARCATCKETTNHIAVQYKLVEGAL